MCKLNERSFKEVRTVRTVNQLRVTPYPGDRSLEGARGRGTSHGGFLACLGRFKGCLRRFEGF